MRQAAAQRLQHRLVTAGVIVVAGSLFDRKGRRPLMFISCAGMVSALLLLGGYLLTAEGSTHTDSVGPVCMGQLAVVVGRAVVSPAVHARSAPELCNYLTHLGCSADCRRMILVAVVAAAAAVAVAAAAAAGRLLQCSRWRCTSASSAWAQGQAAGSYRLRSSPTPSEQRCLQQASPPPTNPSSARSPAARALPVPSVTIRAQSDLSCPENAVALLNRVLNLRRCTRGP